MYARPQGDYYPAGAQGDWASIWKGVQEFGKQVVGGLAGGYIAQQTGGTYTPPPMGTAKPAPPGGFPMVPGYGGGVISFPGGTPVAPGGTTMVPGRGRLPPFTATGAGVLPGGGRTAGAIPSGWHFDKRTGTYLVRNRRMNIANPRALRRAMRRVQGFEKLARRTITFTRRVKMRKRKTS